MTNTQEKLQQVKSIARARADKLTENLNDISKDFIGNYGYNDINYLSDAFTEYADNQTSVYYSDQKKYYLEHSDECESALLEYYGNDTLAKIINDDGLEALICKAGAVGEYEKNYSELSDNEDEIKEVLALMLIYNGGCDNDICDMIENNEQNGLTNYEDIIINYLIDNLIDDMQ